jgi:DNA-binding beta-propeller fold protein YncE
VRVQFCLLATLVFALARSSYGQSLPDGFYPESLAVAADGTLFTGSAVEASIVRIRPGAATAEPFIPTGTGGLMSVEGLLVDDTTRRLYACTSDLGVAISPKTETALLAFDVMTGAFLHRWPLPEGGFCNDLVRAPDGGLLITDSAKPRLLKFDPASAGLSVWVEDPLLGGAQLNGNGIAIDDNNVYVDTFSDGRLIRVPMLVDGHPGTPQLITLPRPLAGADALRSLSPGYLMAFENDIPGGNGRVTIIALHGDIATLQPVAEGLAEPVSGLVTADKVLIVESQFRKLLGADKGHVSDTFRLRTIGLPRPGAGLRSIELPKGAAYPNGIARRADGTMFIGQITDGAIWQQSAQGAWSQFFPGADTAFAGTALRLDDAHNLLWVASPDFLPKGRKPRPHRVVAIDSRSGRLQQSLKLPDAGFANDFVLEPNGSVLITDSTRGLVLELAPGTGQFKTVIEDRVLGPVNGIGVAGIARAPDGQLILGNYGSGHLYVMRSGHLRELSLPRILENPDGIAFAEDGALIVLEGAVESGNGTVLRIPSPFVAGRRPIEVLAYGLESPTNLTLGPRGVMLVTESRIRHRLLPGREAEVPENFRVVEVPTQPGGTP